LCQLVARLYRCWYHSVHVTWTAGWCTGLSVRARRHASRLAMARCVLAGLEAWYRRARSCALSVAADLCVPIAPPRIKHVRPC
jgi:hypothetical protein